jgi:hypothetical protein
MLWSHAGVRVLAAQLPRIRTLARSRSARVVALGVLVGYWVLLPIPGSSDAHNIWMLNLADPYRGNQLGDQDAFLYSPPAALVISPFTELPFPIFYRMLLAANLLSMMWLLGGPWAALALLLPPVQVELQTGNIHLLMAAGIVLGFRSSAAWAALILTKATPAVGLLWFAARREWRPLLVAVGTTVAIAVVTWVLVPRLWAEWIDLLVASSTVVVMNFTLVQIPVFVRLPVAAGIAVIAGWRGDRWLVPVAVLVALPAIWIGALTILLAVIPLLNQPDLPGAKRTKPAPNRVAQPSVSQ